jgi:hypothetical protein
LNAATPASPDGRPTWTCSANVGSRRASSLGQAAAQLAELGDRVTDRRVHTRAQLDRAGVRLGADAVEQLLGPRGQHVVDRRRQGHGPGLDRES